MTQETDMQFCQLGLFAFAQLTSNVSAGMSCVSCISRNYSVSTSLPFTIRKQNLNLPSRHMKARRVQLFFLRNFKKIFQREINKLKSRSAQQWPLAEVRQAEDLARLCLGEDWKKENRYLCVLEEKLLRQFVKNIICFD